MEDHLNILLLEDSETDADLLIRFLKKETINLDYTRVWDRNAFLHEVNELKYDLIIADHNLPQFSGMEAFRLCKQNRINLPFIIVTGSVSEKLLTEYTKEGIDDYILKENLLRLPSAIENVISRKKIENLNEELTKTNIKLNNAYSDIKDSINYAKLLQEAILPDTSILSNHFPGSFIYFKPRDIISGDFFWFEQKEDEFFVSVADCTGHGVPGAMLAMMGNNLINEAVNIKKLTEPNKILERLNKQVKRMLKQDKTSVYDGMDIAFCIIDPNKKTLRYAGANRPLYIERQRKIIEFKFDKVSIGELGVNNDIKFTNHKIDIQSGDRIFLFTDGYADQFSEKTDKKITVKQLKELMLQSAFLPPKDQKKFISSFFEEWKGKSEQIDDVLLMCISIP